MCTLVCFSSIAALSTYKDINFMQSPGVLSSQLYVCLRFQLCSFLDSLKVL